MNLPLGMPSKSQVFSELDGSSFVSLVVSGSPRS
jgi:hypothetical protein